MAERKGFPAALGQCRRQPGVLKSHSQDGFLPAFGQAAPFESLPLLSQKYKNTLKGVFIFGGEKGIRTLEYIPALHDFQSCAFDQLSHLSTVYDNELLFSLILLDRKHSSHAATNSAISPWSTNKALLTWRTKLVPKYNTPTQEKMQAFSAEFYAGLSKLGYVWPNSLLHPAKTKANPP